MELSIKEKQENKKKTTQTSSVFNHRLAMVLSPIKIRKTKVLVEGSLLDMNSLNVHDSEFIHVLTQIIKKDSTKRNPPDIHVVKSFLNESELMSKFKTDKEISSASFNHLMNICSAFINYKVLKKGQILFKIGDIGDAFYIVITGNLTVLKPIENSRIKITPQEYFEHLLTLRTNEEKFILAKTLKENLEVLFIRDISEFEKVLSFLVRYIFLWEANLYTDLEEVETLFNSYKKSLVDFEIKKSDIFNIDGRVKRIKLDFYKSKETDESWIQFLKSKLSYTEEECTLYLKHVVCLLKDKDKKDIVTFSYQKFLSLHSGQYFGDFALDNIDKKRNATIRADDECFLGVITNEVYDLCLLSEKRKLKIKELAFLNENFFFRKIYPPVFEKRYFSHFAPNVYPRNHDIYKEGSPSKKLILIKEGFIELTFNGSLIDLNNVLTILKQKIFDIYTNKKYNSFLIEADLKKVEELSNEEDFFSNLKYKCPEIIKQLNSKRVVHISIITVKDVCGIEEIFLGNLNRVLKASVHSEKANIYKLEFNKIKYIIENETDCYKSYLKISTSKVFSLIKRLSHVKHTLLKKCLIEIQKNENENKIEILNKEKQEILELKQFNGIRILKQINKIDENMFNKYKNGLEINNLDIISNLNNMDQNKNKIIKISDIDKIDINSISPNLITERDCISNEGFLTPKINNKAKLLHTDSNNQILQIPFLNLFDSVQSENTKEKFSIPPIKLLKYIKDKGNEISNELSTGRSKKDESLSYGDSVLEKIRKNYENFKSQSVINLNYKYQRDYYFMKANENSILITTSAQTDKLRTPKIKNKILKETSSTPSRNKVIKIVKPYENKLSTKSMEGKQTLFNSDKEISISDFEKNKYSKREPRISRIDISHSLNVNKSKSVIIKTLKENIDTMINKNCFNKCTRENVENMVQLFTNTDYNNNKAKGKCSVKSVKEFYSKNKLEGYTNLALSKNSILKMQINKNFKRFPNNE